MRRVLLFAALLILVLGAGIGWFFLFGGGGAALVRWALKPDQEFSAYRPPPAPDYSDPRSWAGLPGRNDKADVRPAGESAASREEQRSARADVFFIHPTTYINSDSWNGPLDDEDAADFLENGVMRFQASAFNLCCRVYAPRYRQATLWSFMDPGRDGVKALALAYTDVRRAFEHFILRFNRGRPFILASHSQGSAHGSRLLQEVIAADPDLRGRMIAAYLIGTPLPADLGIGMAACDGPEQTGCYMNWNAVDSSEGRETWLESDRVWLGGEMTSLTGRPLLCVNPLDWRKDGSAPAGANKGSLPGNAEEEMPGLVPGLTGARCENGLLVLTEPPEDRAGFSTLVNEGDYHVYDYNLFYANIRENAAARAGAFLKGR